MKLNEVTDKKSVPNPSDLRHLKPWMYKAKPKIERWMDINNIEGYVDPDTLMIYPSTANVDLSHFNGRHIFVRYQNRKCLPVCFKFAQTFDADGIGLENFYGSPFLVHNDFRCRKARLNDKDAFQDAPKTISGRLTGSTETHITNFRGLEDCNITDIYFGGYAAPNEAMETAIKVDNIGGLPKSLLNFYVYNLRSISGIHKQCPNLRLLHINRNVPDGLLSILRTQDPHFMFGFVGNDFWDLERAYKIVQKHVDNERNVFDCQEELLVNGLKEYAKL